MKFKCNKCYNLNFLLLIALIKILLIHNQKVRNFMFDEIKFNPKLADLVTETDNDEDFGFGASYPSISSGKYNYRDYHIFQKKYEDYFNITVVSPDLPYFVIKKDINVIYNELSENFEILFKNARVFPENLSTYSRKSVDFKDLIIVVYPAISLNKIDSKSEKRLAHEFMVKIEELKTLGSNVKYLIEILIDKAYFTIHEKWKNMTSAGTRLINIRHYKGEKESIRDKLPTKGIPRIDYLIDNPDSPTGKTLFGASFDVIKENVVSEKYKPNDVKSLLKKK